jgi:hypothetical protein
MDGAHGPYFLRRVKFLLSRTQTTDESRLQNLPPPHFSFSYIQTLVVLLSSFNLSLSRSRARARALSLSLCPLLMTASALRGRPRDTVG